MEDYSLQLNKAKLIKMVKKFGHYERKEASILFQIDEKYNMLRISEKWILLAVSNAGLKQHIVEISPLANAAIYFIKFKTEEMLILFKDFVKKIIGIKTLFPEDIAIERTVNVSLAWLPIEAIITNIVPQLEQYGKVFAVTPKRKFMDEHNFYESTPVSVQLELNENVTMEQVPYVFTDDVGNRSWVFMDGKSKACFKCLKPGHDLKHCKLTWCSYCRAYLDQHVCKISYAQAVADPLPKKINYLEMDQLSEPMNTTKLFEDNVPYGGAGSQNEIAVSQLTDLKLNIEGSKQINGQGVAANMDDRKILNSIRLGDSLSQDNLSTPILFSSESQQLVSDSENSNCGMEFSNNGLELNAEQYIDSGQEKIMSKGLDKKTFLKSKRLRKEENT